MLQRTNGHVERTLQHGAQQGPPPLLSRILNAHLQRHCANKVGCQHYDILAAQVICDQAQRLRCVRVLWYAAHLQAQAASFLWHCSTSTQPYITT